MLNPPLLLVSALFFLATTTILYLAAWSVAAGIMRTGRGHLSHAAAKRILMMALALPPLLAVLPTVSGSTLRHVHGAAAVMEHHSMACQQVFVRALALGGLAGGGATKDALGGVVSAAAWLLVAVGLFLVLRLLRATARLEHGLTLYQNEPSARLAAALVRVGECLPGLPARRFFECPIPPAYSSVLGFWRARCVLSQEFVASAPDEELDAVVAHEGSHLRAGDVRATFAVGVLNCLFFYLRPVRLLSRAWREAAELACDDAAVAATRKPLAMAAAILRASGVPVGAARFSRPLPAVALPFADEAACAPSIRVERLLAQAQQASLPAAREPRWQAALGWFTTLTLGGIGAGVLLSAEAACYAHCSLEAIARVLH